MGLNFALLTSAGAGSLIGMLPTILLFGGLMYFMIIRPQKKRQQQAQNLLNSLSVGDKIQTIGGFIGEVVSMEEDELVIDSEGTKLRIKKNAVAIRVDAVETVTETEAAPTTENDDDEDFKIEDFEI